ncbi:MAG: GNAT family N-acetyltransferase, partial [Rhodospirillales bacterium]|nr:GNAT family N-acetyltransferase [Rhodospirillales bacterium]
MLRIRKITDARSIANRTAVEEAQGIIRRQFPGISAEEIDKLPSQLDNPFLHQFVAQLFVAESGHGNIRAVAVLLYDPDLMFSYLEIITTAPDARRGSGVGGALYDRIREEAAAIGSRGLYFECLPDDPESSPDPETRKQNAARLKFYERYGAFPIVGTGYDLPISEGDTDMPFLVFDGLGAHGLPDASALRKIVRAILERKYGHLCPPEYIRRVVDSVKPVGFGLRPPRYVKAAASESVAALPPLKGRVPLVVNDLHDIHHIGHDRGYVEAPVRMSAILREIDKSGIFHRIPSRKFPDRYIVEVHNPGLFNYIRSACAEAPVKKSVYPYVFPIRNPQRKPKEKSVLAGYWCIDTFTPLNRNVWPAARQAVDCALTAADHVLQGAPLAYALVRPPGHHAEKNAFGGFCYFNNGAIAANYLSRFGRVAMLDIDYHHGNGQQDIFYKRDDVLTVSIHGHPSFAYPYFSGFKDETGRGDGAGFNMNIPLPETITPEQYREALTTALKRVARHKPAFLVVSLGLDTGRGDPTGTWSNMAADFRRIGQMIGECGYPILVVQEGGYRVRTLGSNARNFFTGLAGSVEAAPRSIYRSPGRSGRSSGMSWREAVRGEDVERIRRLVSATGMFTAEETAIAGELVAERIEKGRASGYEFIVAEEQGQLAGYACYGLIPGTDTSYDLYWIAVHPDLQKHGLGRHLMARTEAAIRQRKGRLMYADTSSSDAYTPTRAFYERMGFTRAADLVDFYRVGDG